jgi:hypothetical protein
MAPKKAYFMDLVMQAIGTIRSPFVYTVQTPIQPTRSSAKGQNVRSGWYADPSEV